MVRAVSRVTCQRTDTAAEKFYTYLGLECGLVENWNKTSRVYVKARRKGPQSTQTSYTGYTGVLYGCRVYKGRVKASDVWLCAAVSGFSSGVGVRPATPPADN